MEGTMVKYRSKRIIIEGITRYILKICYTLIGDDIMPYKDKIRHRDYYREYMRKYRARNKVQCNHIWIYNKDTGVWLCSSCLEPRDI